MAHQLAAVYIATHSRHTPALGVLPHDVALAVIKRGRIVAVAGNHPVIVLKLFQKVFVIEILVGIEHGLAAIVFLHQNQKLAQVFHEFCGRHAATRFHVDKRHEVNVLLFDSALQVLKLHVYVYVGPVEVIGSHTDACAACFANVKVVVFVNERGALSSFNVSIRNLRGGYFVPVDFILLVAHVNTIPRLLVDVGFAGPNLAVALSQPVALGTCGYGVGLSHGQQALLGMARLLFGGRRECHHKKQRQQG